MCDVTYATYAMLALSVAGAVEGYNSQKKSAAAQQAIIEEGIAKDQAATKRLYEQINESAQDEKQQRHTEYLVDKARIMAIQAESGLMGANYDRAIQKTEDNADTDIATIERNTQRKLENANSQAQAKDFQARVQMTGIRHPSKTQTALQIAGYGADAYGTYKDPNYMDKRGRR